MLIYNVINSESQLHQLIIIYRRPFCEKYTAGFRHFVEHAISVGQFVDDDKSTNITEFSHKHAVRFNAYTNRTTICFLWDWVGHRQQLFFDTVYKVFSDLKTNISIGETEIERERQIVKIESLSPNSCSYVGEYIYSQIYGLENSIIGTAKEIDSFELHSINNYIATHMTPENMTILKPKHIEFMRPEEDKYFLKFNRIPYRLNDMPRVQRTDRLLVSSIPPTILRETIQTKGKHSIVFSYIIDNPILSNFDRLDAIFVYLLEQEILKIFMSELVSKFFRKKYATLYYTTVEKQMLPIKTNAGDIGFVTIFIFRSLTSIRSEFKFPLNNEFSKSVDDFTNDDNISKLLTISKINIIDRSEVFLDNVIMMADYSNLISQQDVDIQSNLNDAYSLLQRNISAVTSMLKIKIHTMVPTMMNLIITLA